ncbi:hypothetical protein MKW92_034885, partial [Papaver armeniacum]
MEDVIDSKEIVEDSINTELVTDFSRNSSTPLEDEDDDSHELELNPPYLFVESEDVNSLTGRSLPFDEVKTPEQIEFSKDFITHLVLNCKNFLYLHLDLTHSIFDRGKFVDGSVFVDDYHGRTVDELVLKHGYRFNSLFRNSFEMFLVEDGYTSDGNYLLVKMLKLGIMCFKGKYVISHQM